MSIQKTVLPNGLTIISENNDSAISTLLSFWVKVGGHFETQHPYGTAHFLEHMLFKGTKKRTKDDISEQMDECGGRLNGGTSTDSTRYYTYTPFDKWREGLEILTDMVFNSTFPGNELEMEKKVVLEEIKRAEDDPFQYGSRLLLEKLRGAHPERASNLGTAETVASITRDHLLDFHKQYYQPSNMLFIATGRMDHEALVEFLASQSVDVGVPVHSKLELAALTEMPLSGETIHIQRPMKQTHLHWGMYGPITGTRDKRIGSLVSHLLGGSHSSRLYRIIRSERGLAYSVRASTSGNACEGFLIGYVATDVQKCEEAQCIVIEEYNRLRTEPVSDKALQIAKNSMIGRYLIAQDSKEARNSTLAHEEMYGISLNPLDVSDEIKNITAEDIQAFANRYFGQEKMLFIRVGEA